jgi:hypothetical protein
MVLNAISFLLLELIWIFQLFDVIFSHLFSFDNINNFQHSKSIYIEGNRRKWIYNLDFIANRLWAMFFVFNSKISPGQCMSIFNTLWPRKPDFWLSVGIQVRCSAWGLDYVMNSYSEQYQIQVSTPTWVYPTQYLDGYQAPMPIITCWVVCYALLMNAGLEFASITKMANVWQVMWQY